MRWLRLCFSLHFPLPLPMAVFLHDISFLLIRPVKSSSALLALSFSSWQVRAEPYLFSGHLQPVGFRAAAAQVRQQGRDLAGAADWLGDADGQPHCHSTQRPQVAAANLQRRGKVEEMKTRQ